MVAFASFNDVEGQQFPPDEFTPNETLPEPLIKAARKKLRWWQWRKKRAVLDCLSQLDYRFMLEDRLTDMATRSGVIPPEGAVEAFFDGDVRIYSGPWTDFLEWIISNWPAIMEMIMSIISLFAGTREDS